MRVLYDISGHKVFFKEWRRIVFDNFHMLKILTRKEITDAFAGQMLGSIWAIWHPLFLMLFYTLIFSVLFPMKFDISFNLPLDYTSYILAGLVPWLCIQQALTKSCSAISSNSSLVKQLEFPLEILPMIPSTSALLPFSIGLSFLFLYNLLVHKLIYLTYILLPFAIINQLLLMYGLSYALASISVYLKDTKDFLQLYTTVSMFLTPIVFLPSGTPNFLKVIFYLNPFSYLIWVYQDILYYGAITKFYAWIIVFFFCPLIFILGYRTFRKLKVYFGHAL